MNSIFRKIIIRITPALWPVDICSIVRNNRKIVQGGTSKGMGSIALVRLDAIGDFVLWLDAAGGFRNAWPDRHLVLVCNKACASIAQAAGLFDEVVPIDAGRLNFAGNFKFRRQLRRQLETHFSGGVELVVQTVYNRRVYTDLVVSAIPAARKVSVRDDSYNNAAKWALKLTDRIYDELVDTGENLQMELLRNARLVRSLADGSFRAGVPVLPGSGQTDSKEQTGVLQEPALQQPYFVIFPGGSFTAKMWPIDRFARVASYINEKTGWTCVVCGALNEKHLAEKLKEDYDGAFADYTGRTTLLEAIEVIRGARLLVGNDTSGIHFAAATRTPSVCAFGGWHYGRFLPYQVERQDESRDLLPRGVASPMDCYNCNIVHKTPQCKRHIRRTGLFPCVDAVTVEMVISKVDECLAIYGL
jgi:ADP-heptose:LPS heptosyltransferase